MITWDDVLDAEQDARETPRTVLGVSEPVETEAQAWARMSPLERKDDLAYRRARRQAERAEWAAKHPHFCRACEGAGWQNVLVGVDDCCEVETDTCYFCVEHSVCPRCGGPLVGQQCGCGWNLGSDTDGMPPELLDYGATEFTADFRDPFADEVTP